MISGLADTVSRAPTTVNHYHYWSMEYHRGYVRIAPQLQVPSTQPSSTPETQKIRHQRQLSTDTAPTMDPALPPKYTQPKTGGVSLGITYSPSLSLFV